MSQVTLAQANVIVAGALAKGHELKLAPLTVVVLDAGGHPVSVQREDRSGILRFEMATGKAYGALATGFGSREWFVRTSTQPHFVSAVATVSQGRLLPVPGGVLIEDESGLVLGAVGISGDNSDNDEACCVAGVHAAGLWARVGAGESSPPG
jgi:uncharacterized protein GlcG (DUF336 family)